MHAISENDWSGLHMVTEERDHAQSLLVRSTIATCLCDYGALYEAKTRKPTGSSGMGNH